jgi:DNA-directed RNA polymerase alpha subunit
MPAVLNQSKRKSVKVMNQLNMIRARLADLKKSVHQLEALIECEFGSSPPFKIEDMGLSFRTQNILLDNNFKTVHCLMVYPYGIDGLIRLTGFGRRSLNELKAALTKHGLF